MIIEANIWKPDAESDDGTMYESQRVEVKRSDDDEVAIHLRIGSDEWGATIYLSRMNAGALAATLLAAAE